MRRTSLWVLLLLALASLLLGGPFGATETAIAQDQEAEVQEAEGSPELTSSTISALRLREIGPAFMSGRIVEIAVDPEDSSTWYFAAASGGVWKTENAGTTWSPIFDSYDSYSVGTIAVDPNNRFVVWVGTGENNSQRSVGYGDGLYKSIDGGGSFKKVGLDDSQHIARILIDPRDSDTVFVAAQGPLWSPGGDRGVFKTTDGGETWENVLEISENTGVSDMVFDPRDPDVLYASAYQRRRRQWTLLDGGPESGMWKTTDGGETWREINKGLPGGDKGRIGIAISPVNPDVLYAVVEAAEQRGFYRSANRGENWSRVGDYVTGSPQYYQEIIADPHKFDRIYALDTYMMVSEDGGATFTPLGEDDKHVDNHALWIDPEDPEHLINGNDGGLYETFDRGATYRYFPNLPLAQFYKVAVGNDGPFYTVCGGTQDNATQCGPSQTNNIHGIRNSDWYTTVFGDGFGPALDPEDPNIIYSQWQHGGLIRYDRRTQEEFDIKPREEADGPPLRWNWDAALLISPHSHTRLYFGAQILFRSDDRGNTWQSVSPDLTHDMDRNRLDIMGRVWGVDSVRKNTSTSLYGTIVALDESPIVEGLLYVGTDDGLIQVSEDGGQNWRREEEFPGVPDMTYVYNVIASRHDGDTVYAAFNNHKSGDFTPYVLKSTDRGRTWASIASDLPERGSAYSLAQDDEDPNILFLGTEFGLYVTLDGGEKWLEVAGLPTVAIRDVKIQAAEDDVVLASFGRGFWVLDDYSPLRTLNEELLESEAHIFPIKDALAYIQAAPMALDGKAFQGASFYTAENPPFGATFTYYVKDSLQTRRERRRDAEKELAKEGEDVFYPTWEELKAEDREEDPTVVLTVRDQNGGVVRHLSGSTSKGIHRVTWDLRYPGFTPVNTSGDGNGPMAVPGAYTVEVARRVDGALETLTEPVPFEVVALGTPTLPVGDRNAILAFQKEAGELQRAVMGVNAAAAAAAERLELMKLAVERYPGVDPALREQVRALELRLMDLREAISGDPTKRRRNESEMPGLMSRVQSVVGGTWSASAAPTATHHQSYDIAAAEFEAILPDLTTLIETDIPALGRQLEEAGVPYIQGGAVPRWQRR
jgi:photosystem II stability/assembly factor-like uncharacterized protein